VTHGRASSHGANTIRFFGVLVGTLLFGTQPCFGEERDPTAADALFRAGRDALGRGDARTACPVFGESYRLDPAVGTLLNLAECEALIGRLADATEHYRRVLESLDESDERVTLVRSRLSELSPRVPTLVLLRGPGLPSATKVVRDGVSLTPASFGVPLPANPGRHELVVTSPGTVPRHYTVSVAEAESKTLILEVGPPAPPPPKPTALLSMKPPPSPAGGGRKAIAYGLLGAGVVSALSTGVLAWQYAAARSDVLSHCPTVHGCDNAGLRAAGAASFLQAATVAGGVATALCLGGGLSFILLDPGSKGGRSGVGGIGWNAEF
jgi:hypothetical protein